MDFGSPIVLGSKQITCLARRTDCNATVLSRCSQAAMLSLLPCINEATGQRVGAERMPTLLARSFISLDIGLRRRRTVDAPIPIEEVSLRRALIYLWRDLCGDV